MLFRSQYEFAPDDLTAVLAILDRGLRALPDNEGILWDRASFCLHFGRIDEAAAMCERLPDTEHGMPWSRLTRAAPTAMQYPQAECCPDDRIHDVEQLGTLWAWLDDAGSLLRPVDGPVWTWQDVVDVLNLWAVWHMVECHGTTFSKHSYHFSIGTLSDASAEDVQRARAGRGGPDIAALLPTGDAFFAEWADIKRRPQTDLPLHALRDCRQTPGQAVTVASAMGGGFGEGPPPYMTMILRGALVEGGLRVTHFGVTGADATFADLISCLREFLDAHMRVENLMPKPHDIMQWRHYWAWVFSLDCDAKRDARAVYQLLRNSRTKLRRRGSVVTGTDAAGDLAYVLAYVRIARGRRLFPDYRRREHVEKNLSDLW